MHNRLEERDFENDSDEEIKEPDSSRQSELSLMPKRSTTLRLDLRSLSSLPNYNCNSVDKSRKTLNEHAGGGGDFKITNFTINSMNSTSQVPISTFSIEHREVGEKPVYLANLIRFNEQKRGPRSMKCDNEYEELSKSSPLKRVSI
jgi:hypothetical protein